MFNFRDTRTIVAVFGSIFGLAVFCALVIKICECICGKKPRQGNGASTGATNRSPNASDRQATNRSEENASRQATNRRDSSVAGRSEANPRLLIAAIYLRQLRYRMIFYK